MGSNRQTFLFGKNFPFSRRLRFWQLKASQKNYEPVFWKIGHNKNTGSKEPTKESVKLQSRHVYERRGFGKLQYNRNKD